MTARWKFAGRWLDEFGIVTEIDNYLDIAARRNDNILVPYRDGRVHATKYFDQRTLTFGILLVQKSVMELEILLDDMKTIFGVRSLQTLQAAFRGGVRAGQAEVVGAMQVQRDEDNPLIARCLIDFLLPEPFLRAVVLSTSTTTIDATPKTFTLNNPGTAEERKPVITLTGPLANTKVENLTNDVYVVYNAAIGAGHSVVIDCEDWTAVDETGVNVLSDITHSGDPAFMVLQPGNNSMKVSDGVHTTGTVKIEFYPPYM